MTTSEQLPYEQMGRRRQKSRTRAALVAATRELLARGVPPTVEQVAADISRTTAYRYFPNQGTLVAAAHPEIELWTLLPDDVPADPPTRLDLVLAGHARIIRDWEAQLRAALRLSLDRPSNAPGRCCARAGRSAGSSTRSPPLRDTHPGLDLRRLAVAIRSATGIKAYVWLVDVAGLSRDDAAEQLCRTGRALLRAAMAGNAP